MFQKQHDSFREEKKRKKEKDLCIKKKLTINPTKTKVVNFGNSKTKTTWLLGSKLDDADSVMYLGLEIDSKLFYKTQIDKVWKKLAQFNGVLYKARDISSKRILLKLYSTYAKPKIAYGLLAYGSTTKNSLNGILVMQKRILRTIFLKKKFDSISDILCRELT